MLHTDDTDVLYWQHGYCTHTWHDIHIAHGKNRYQTQRTQRTQSVVLGGTTPQLNIVWSNLKFASPV